MENVELKAQIPLVRLLRALTCAWLDGHEVHDLRRLALFYLQRMH